jgi:hypothetical protein
MAKRYCAMCDKRVTGRECPLCGADTERWPEESRKPTRHERLQGLADRGVDTWEEYRGER